MAWRKIIPPAPGPHLPMNRNILIRTILPHPIPLPLGEGESSSDGLTRRTIIPVQGFNARKSFRRILTLTLSPPIRSGFAKATPDQMGAEREQRSDAIGNFEGDLQGPRFMVPMREGFRGSHGFSFERFSLTPALSHKERENCPPMVGRIGRRATTNDRTDAVGWPQIRFALSRGLAISGGIVGPIYPGRRSGLACPGLLSAALTGLSASGFATVADL